ncbi:MAG: DUF2279 domain-containing protein [Saprospiraceae bacterium]|nr:DUF2279 domain-containing protein [Saprospiraceae bacterium]
MKTLVCCFFLCLGAHPPAALAQSAPPHLFSLQAADTLHRPRFWTALGAGTATYAASMTGLYKAWYADYPATRFHFFNDLGEWNQMDKMGHWLMSYNESRWVYGGARWTGLPPRMAAWVGFAGGQLIQTSFEIFDGFSAQWGFSWSDIGFNLLGSGLFLGQQLGWSEQRILLKMSAWPVSYSPAPIYPVTPAGSTQWTSLDRRADELYGTGPVSLFLKNYNTLVVWASVNPAAFLPGRAPWLPRWLNLAVGMGADNLFAGFGYDWQADKDCRGPDCVRYRVDAGQYPRTRQFFLSLDVDLSRLPVRNRFLRSLLGAVNIIKFPAPALELNSRGRLRLHPLYF